MQITFLMASETQAQGAKGPYTVMEATYKDQMGKPASKKFFTNSVAYKVLKGAKQGDVFEVTTVKNDKGYLDWTAVSPATGATTSTPFPTLNTDTPAPTKPAFTPGGKTTSTYATPEERAMTQIYIVRQSSLKLAVDEGKKGRDVFLRASEFEEFVFNGTIPPQEEDAPVKKTPTKKAPAPVESSGFDDLEDDIL